MKDILHLLDYAETSKLAAWLSWYKAKSNNQKSIKSGGQMDREKLWSTFHAIRSTGIYVQKWNKFLEGDEMMQQPYQELTIGLFEGLVKCFTPLKTSSTTVNVHPMT